MTKCPRFFSARVRLSFGFMRSAGLRPSQDYKDFSSIFSRRRSNPQRPDQVKVERDPRQRQASERDEGELDLGDPADLLQAPGALGRDDRKETGQLDKKIHELFCVALQARGSVSDAPLEAG